MKTLAVFCILIFFSSCGTNTESTSPTSESVTINSLSPLNQSEFFIGEYIVFKTSIESKTQVAAPKKIEWKSNLDGVFSSDLIFEYKGLQLGEHEITQTLTFKDNSTVENKLNITIYGALSIDATSFYNYYVRTDNTLWKTIKAKYYNKVENEVFKDSTEQIFTSVEKISVGIHHCLILKSDKTLWATGNNDRGVLGIGKTIARNWIKPTKVMSDVNAISAGKNHSLIMKEDGTLWANGSTTSGQLGDGSLMNTTNVQYTPKQIMSEVKAISTGEYHSLILKTDNTLWATGNNYYGQLGDGTNTNKNTPVYIMSDVKAIFSGQYHSLIIKTDNSLWATGANDYGQLGDGTTGHKNKPVQIMIDNIKSISAGFAHTMILKNDNTLWGAGNNSYGQLGDGSKTNKTSFVQLMTDIKYISARAMQTMVIKNNNTVWVTGANGFHFTQPTSLVF